MKPVTKTEPDKVEKINKCKNGWFEVIMDSFFSHSVAIFSSQAKIHPYSLTVGQANVQTCTSGRQIWFFKSLCGRYSNTMLSPDLSIKLSCILFTRCIIWLRTFFSDISDGIPSDVTQRVVHRNRSTYIKINDIRYKHRFQWRTENQLSILKISFPPGDHCEAGTPTKNFLFRLGEIFFWYLCWLQGIYCSLFSALKTADKLGSWRNAFTFVKISFQFPPAVQPPA